jgi:hypothetical protein
MSIKHLISMTYEDRENIMITLSLDESNIYQDEDAREYYYETDEEGIREKVYLEDLLLNGSLGETE